MCADSTFGLLRHVSEITGVESRRAYNGFRALTELISEEEDVSYLIEPIAKLLHYIDGNLDDGQTLLDKYQNAISVDSKDVFLSAVIERLEHHDQEEQAMTSSTYGISYKHSVGLLMTNFSINGIMSCRLKNNGNGSFLQMFCLIQNLHGNL